MAEYNITILQKNSSGTLDSFNPKTVAAQVVESETKQFVSAAKKQQYDENTVFTSDVPIVEPIGAIEPGDTFTDTPVKTMLQKILYPYVKPTISGTASVASRVVEKGITTTVNSVTALVGKKSEAITKVELYKDSTLVEAKTDDVAAGGSFSFTNAVSITDTATLKVKATDAEGSVVEADCATYTYVYPFFYGTVAIGATVDAATVAAMSKLVVEKGDAPFTFNLDNDCAVIAYPKAYGALDAIVDKHGFDNLASFTRSEVVVTCSDSSTQTYYVYVKEPATATAFELTAKF